MSQYGVDGLYVESDKTAAIYAENGEMKKLLQTGRNIAATFPEVKASFLCVSVELGVAHCGQRRHFSVA
jgi:hypothetical protein